MPLKNSKEKYAEDTSSSDESKIKVLQHSSSDPMLFDDKMEKYNDFHSS